MNTYALVSEYLPGIDRDTAGAVLWNLTRFPFGDESHIRRMLADVSRYWSPARRTWIVDIWAVTDAEISYHLRQARAVVRCSWCGSQQDVQGDEEWRLCATCRAKCERRKGEQS